MCGNRVKSSGKRLDKTKVIQDMGDQVLKIEKAELSLFSENLRNASCHVSVVSDGLYDPDQDCYCWDWDISDQSGNSVCLNGILKGDGRVNILIFNGNSRNTIWHKEFKNFLKIIETEFVNSGGEIIRPMSILQNLSHLIARKPASSCDGTTEPTRTEPPNQP